MRKVKLPVHKRLNKRVSEKEEASSSKDDKKQS